MAITTDELRILLKINGESSYTTTMNKVINVTENYNKTCTNLISTLAKFVTGGLLVRFGKQCIEAASNLQEVANVVNVTFGKSAAIVSDWAKQNAANFGLSETSAKRYAGTFGTMAKQFSFTEEQATQMAVELTKLSGDLASFYNITDQAAATKLKAVFTGETEGLKELGVVMTQTQLDAYAMAKGWGKTTKEMSEQEKVALRYTYTMEKLAHAQGDFSRTSDGYANSVRRLQLELENMKVAVGAELLPVAVSGLQTITALIKAVAPTVVRVAQYVRLYAQAWQNASDKTKNFARIALGCFVVMAVYPTVLKLIDRAVKILTMDVFTLKGALSLFGLVFAALAFKDLTDSVKEMKSSGGIADQISGLESAAAAGASAVGDLADSMDDLGQSTKGLETFLASFDEVNKVGGSGSSIMSKLVTVDDISNILNMTGSIDDLQSSLDSLELPELTPTLGSIFDGDFWSGLAEDVMGFLDTFFVPSEFWDNWKRGFKDVCDAVYAFDDWLKENAPHWHDFFESIGTGIWDQSHDKNGNALTVGAMAADALLGAHDYDSGESFKFTNRYGYESEALKYNLDGSYTTAYLKYGNQAQAPSSGGDSSPQVTVNPNIYLDGEKVSKSVANHLNNQQRSGSDSLYMTVD